MNRACKYVTVKATKEINFELPHCSRPLYLTPHQEASLKVPEKMKINTRTISQEQWHKRDVAVLINEHPISYSTSCLCKKEYKIHKVKNTLNYTILIFVYSTYHSLQSEIFKKRYAYLDFIGVFLLLLCCSFLIFQFKFLDLCF